MQSWQALLLGAAGGFFIQILAVFHAVSRWEQARTTKTGQVKVKPPRFTRYVDWKAHLITGGIRLTLGGGTAGLFTLAGQVSQPFVALTLGFSAPAILTQLGSLGMVNGSKDELQSDNVSSTSSRTLSPTQVIQISPAVTPRSDSAAEMGTVEPNHGN
ncbi:hypothetical protein [Nocardia colli]|uniref:hypothetical protein n=1 Tax=Nocardia colli TaxID=2545717 RepID=UPI0035D7DA6B